MPACSVRRGDTAVLMADGRTRELRHIRPGDADLRHGDDRGYRRYVVTRVLDHWMVRKPAYRVTLENGTELVTSGDHRLLSNRGWKYVTGAEQGPLQRPHLTVNNKLVGTGAFAEPPRETVDYKRGYLCGVIRGDGHLATRVYARPNGREWQQQSVPARAHGFRGAFTRSYATSHDLSVATTPFLFAAAHGPHTVRSARSGRSHGRPSRRSGRSSPGRAVRRSTGTRASSPGSSTPRARSAAASSRICNTDPTIIDWTTFACRQFGFAVRRRERVGRGQVERPHPRRPRAAAPLPPPDRPGDHAQALDRGRARSSRRAG